MAPEESAKVRDEGQDLRTEPRNSVQSAIIKEPWNDMHMSCICHAYVMHMSCNAAIRSAFRPNSDPNVDATTDSAGMLNLAATCNKCATANNNMFTTSSQHLHNMFQPATNARDKQKHLADLAESHNMRSTGAPPAGGQLGISKQFKQIAALSWHGAPIWEDKRFWTIFGQYLGNCRILETYRFYTETLIQTDCSMIAILWRTRSCKNEMWAVSCALS